MSLCRSISLFCAVSCALAVMASFTEGSAQESRPAHNRLTDQEAKDGWRLLFDGKTSQGWRGYRKNAFPEKGWEIADGTLHVMAGGGGGDLMPLETFEDFELSLEWRIAEGANSGIMYRVREEANAPWHTGPEYQILDDAKYPNASPSTLAGGLYALYDPENREVMPVGQYNTAKIRQVGDKVEHWLNGRKILEADLGSEDWKKRVAASKFKAYAEFGKHRRGYIVLQDHGNDVWFRNIKVRDLRSPQPAAKSIDLFNGKDLTGWKAILPEGASAADVWSVEDAVLVCKGRPAGYIRTEQDFTNYMLEVEWRFRPGSKGGNSGVLLRMTGEDKVWPKSIEAQLQAGNAGDFWNIDKFPMTVTSWRTRGRNTKKTHANEKPIGEWNRYEILVDGGHVVLRVNGDVLNEAWDAEVIPGKICLQSEGAEIHFRKVRLTPLSAR